MKQITVLVHNSSGIIAQLTQVLGAQGVNIETLDGESAQEHGIVTMTVDRYDRALIALRDAGFPALSEDALIIRLKDEPGALAKVAARFKDADLNIRSLRIVKREAGSSLVTLVSDNNEKARELVALELAVQPALNH